MSSCLSWIRWWLTRCGMEVAFPTSLQKLPRSSGNAWPHQSWPFRGSQTKRLSTLPPTTFCKHQGTDSEAIFPLFFLDFGELEVFTLRCNLRMCFPQVANDVKSQKPVEWSVHRDVWRAHQCMDIGRKAKSCRWGWRFSQCHRLKRISKKIEKCWKGGK